MKIFAAVIAVALPGGGAIAQSTPPEDPSLIAYLQQRVGEAADTTRYTAALTPDGKTALVYLTGPAWCGSGGCRLLVLDRDGSAYRSVGEISVAIATSSPHRAEAYEASRYVIEEIKKRLPVWKLEQYVEGAPAWVEGHPLETPVNGEGFA